MEPVSEALSQKFKNMAIVCAMLVVLIHIPLGKITPEEPLWLFRWLIPWGISQIGVPFFFVASGYFFAGHIGEDGWWRRELRKRVRTLLVPFILWNGIFFLYGLSLASVADLVAHRALGTSLGFLKSPSYFLLGFYPLEGPTLGSTWYMRTLLLLVCVSPAIVWVLKRFPRVFIIGAWVFSLIAIANNFDGVYYLPRFVVECGRGLVYFSLGIFLRRNPIHVEGRKLWVWSVVIALALLAVHVWQGYTGTFKGVFLGIFSIPFMLYAVWGIIPEKRWAESFTSLAFACYLMHAFVIITLATIARGSGLISNAPKSLVPCLLIVLSAPLTFLLGHAMYRYFPRVSAVLFGGR